MSHDTETPGLFGLGNSNRDFSDPESWGKNKFNSSFPAALCCYLSSLGLSANYLQFSDGRFSIDEISIRELFGADASAESTFFGFETPFSRYDQYTVGANPRTDLVVSTTGDHPRQTAALEVKLTALPDQTTHRFDESEYGAELVVRPDTIFYLSAGLAHDNRNLVETYFRDRPVVLSDWADPAEALAKFADIHAALSKFLTDPGLVQRPNIVQPVWKTIGKSPILAQHCLDVFAWSNAGLLFFLLSITDSGLETRISRPMRTIIWTYSMILDIALRGKTNFQATTDLLSYNTRNDKAFSATGLVTRNFMKHKNLERPRIQKSSLREIILGGGQNLLSPERRFDAIVVNSPELFS